MCRWMYETGIPRVQVNIKAKEIFYFSHPDKYPSSLIVMDKHGLRKLNHILFDFNKHRIV